MIERIRNRLRRINGIVYPQHIFMPPKWLVLGVNNTCNLHCKMCDVGVNYTQSNFFENLMGSKPVQMPIDLFRRIADEASRFFPDVSLGYAFTEPLIYTHLEESLVYAKRKGLRTSITTNGLGLKKWAPVIDETNVAEVNLSLDGPEDLHNFIRGSKHSYSKAIEGIEALVLRKSKVKINVCAVITEWNVGRLVEFLKALNAFPLERVFMMHSNYTTQQMASQHNAKFGMLYPATASNTTDVNLEKLNTALLWNEIQEIKKTTWNFPIDFYPEIKTSAGLVNYYSHPELFIGKRCVDILSNVMIKSNGDVIPAHGRCYNLTIGNLYKQSLPEIWNSAVMAQFRKTLTDNGGLLPACARCCSSFVE